MGISDRIEGSIENWRVKWGGALRNFLSYFLGKGIELFFDILGKAAAPKLRPLIDSIEATGKVPPELQPVLDELKNPTGEVAAMLAQSAGGSLFGGAFGKILDGILLPVAYAINSRTKNVILNEAQYLALWIRGQITEEEFIEKMYWVGHDDTDIANLKKLTQIRLDPNSIVTAWRRDPALYEALFKDLTDQGWSEDRIEAIKFITQFIPTADEQTHWLAREVYEPEMVNRYGLDDELPNYEETDFSKVGVSPEQMSNKWKAHWEHASYMQVREMLRRGVLSLDRSMPSPPTTEAGWATRDAEGSEAMFDWYRLVEIPPFWRERLTEMIFEVPTRVDVRRFWDMRTIDEERLRSIYHAQGYHGKDLDDYVLWTKVYVAFPDLIARFKNGWITEEVVKSELTALGMSPERLEEMWQTKFKTAQPERVAAEKMATATEIMKAVKKELISRAEGVERLGRLGYSPEEATFKLDVYLGVSEGSPDTYIEFVDWTEKYRKAVGLDAYVPSDELLEAAKAYKADPNPENTYRYRQLLVAYEEGKKKVA